MSRSADIPPTAAIAFNAANNAARKGDHATTLEQCQTALAAHPALGPAHVLMARSLIALGRRPEAKKAYLAATDIDKSDFSAQLELGNMYLHDGEARLADTAYRAAIRAKPSDSRGHQALALMACSEATEQGEWTAARHHQIALHCAETEDPDNGPARVDQLMGHKRLETGQTGAACTAFTHALARLGHDRTDCSALEADICLDLAETCFRLDLNAYGKAHLERAARTTDRAALKRAARLSYRQNHWKEAILILQRASVLYPDDRDMRLELADTQVNSWDLEGAAQTADEVAKPYSPHEAYVIGLLRARIASRMGDADAALREYEQIKDLDADGLASQMAMTALYSDDADPQEWAIKTRAKCTGWGQNARAVASFKNDPATDRPLRIGMVAADLHRQHPVDIFLQPMLASWNNHDFPLTIYHTGKTHDTRTRLARSRAGQWRTLTPDRLGAAVTKDAIDILIDLSGHTHSAELKQFARRMAPVQATYLGYPGSTGVPNIDFLIGDSIVTPDAHAAQYSEKLIQLETAVFSYAPEEEYPLPEFGAHTRPLTFGSFNNIPKLTPRTLDLWSAILHRLSDAQLLLKAPSFQDKAAVARFINMFGDRGIAPERLQFRGPSALLDMMGEYADVDIALDPLPYNGGTTSLQAMWMGVPVITRTGNQFVSRMGASFMTHAGLSDWVAQTDAEYIQIAVEKAQDPEALIRLKRGLRTDLLSRSSWNTKKFLEGFENALRQMWINRAHS